MNKIDGITKDHTVFADIDSLDDSAIDQFKEAMKMDFVVKGALMPDTHKGYTLPIGAVIATKGVIDK